MPTAAEYDAFAVALDGVDSDAATFVAGPLGAFDLGAVADVPRAATAVATIEDTRADVAAARQVVRDLAAECRRRAGVCRTYDIEMDAYDTALAAHREAVARHNTVTAGWDPILGGPMPERPVLRTAPPVLPAPWVTRS